VNAEELARLMDSYRDGTISEEDARRLAAAIREGGDSSKTIVRELQFEGILARALEGEDGEAFARSFRERVAAEESENAFVRAFEGRRRRALPAPRSSGGWLPWVVAAAALVAVVLALPSEPAKTSSAKIAERPNRMASTDSTEAPRSEAPVQEPPKSETPRKIERSRGIPTPAAPAPPEVKSEPPIVPPPNPGRPHEEKVLPAATTPVFLTVSAIRGGVFLVEGAERIAIRDGHGVAGGQGLESVGPKSSAVAIFADGTRVELGPDTVIREIADKKGKRVVIAKGTIAAQVVHQPADAPMIFATPHAEARVLGTLLRLDVESQTRLEVSEGKVRLARHGGKSADIAAGHFAVAGPGVEPLAKAVHPDDVVLLASHAKIVGDEWALVPDRNASGAWALQVAKSPFKPIDHVEGRPSYAVFTFHASSEREYHLWMRSASLPTSDKWLRDLVTVEPQGCTMSQKSPFFGAAPTTAYVFTGLSSWNGYAWSSGSVEEARPDKEPILVRFQKTGTQTLRLFTVHPSIRIDCIWLSARQASRPPAKSFPPAEQR
jgi:hypothetical protein